MLLDVVADLAEADGLCRAGVTAAAWGRRGGGVSGRLSMPDQTEMPAEDDPDSEEEDDDDEEKLSSSDGAGSTSGNKMS